jgi:hypothetical protein
MKTPEEEINDLKARNSELVLKVQYWKVTAAQRENEKLELMKELNDLRLNLAVSITFIFYHETMLTSCHITVLYVGSLMPQ